MRAGNTRTQARQAAARSTSMWRLPAAAILAWTGCSFSVDYDSAVFRCDDSTPCPPSFECREGMCFAMDVSDVSGGDSSMSPRESIDPVRASGDGSVMGDSGLATDVVSGDGGSALPVGETGELDGGGEIWDGGDRPTSGPRLIWTRARYLSSEKIVVEYADVPKAGKPFIGIYEQAASGEPIEDHDVRFGRDEEIASDSREFRELPAGTYDVRLVFDDVVVADEVPLWVVSDRDEDGVEDALDGCPDDDKKQQPLTCGCGEDERDDDGDGAPDCVDECSKDRLKTEPGMCGCGFLDSYLDQDSDGVSDCFDECPGDPAKTRRLQCGCGRVDVDTDGDGKADCKDKCPEDPNKTREGECGCGNAETDTDLDGVPDCVDYCPNDPNKDERGTCGCGVADTDRDDDDVPDCIDGCPDDPSKTSPGACGCNVAQCL